jgi:hypothetical protein
MMRTAVEESAAHSESLDPAKLFGEWRNGIVIAHIAHNRAAAAYGRRARAIGLSATLVSAAAGTSLFSSLDTSSDERLIAFAALLSVVAVILSALQTFLNYGDLAARHRAAAGGYGDLRRRTEELLAFRHGAELENPMAEIRVAWANLDQESPDIPQDVHDVAYARVKGPARPAAPRRE